MNLCITKPQEARSKLGEYPDIECLCCIIIYI